MSENTLPNPKLSRRLKRVLLATLLAVLVLATIAAAVSAYLEASDIQDETLLSIAKLVETNQIGAQRARFGSDDGHAEDGEVKVWEVGKTQRKGLSIKPSIKTGFHTFRDKDEFWRVYAPPKDPSGKQYVVAQQLSVSTEIALKSAANTAVPLLLLFLLVPLMISLIVRHSFKPLNTLTRKMNDSESLKLDLAHDKDIPVEVMPFVSAIDTLLEKNEAYNIRQRRFIADAAHELRTPITALSLQIENVHAAKTDEKRQERQDALVASVKRLQRLLNQLLDLARAQSLSGDHSNTVSLNELIKTQIAENYTLIEDKYITISVNRNEPVSVVDNNNQLQHLVRNALSNAIKYAPTSGSIDIDIYEDNGQAVFSIVDNGPGVSDEHIKQLHEPFYTPDNQSTDKGAGLGLAICHEIATHLNGTLIFDNVHPTGFKLTYRQSLA